ncbi:hypothetical protein CPE01_21960 [Cellulomonas persica]|uniref:Ferrous iron transporter FeoA-like domain-containing protein n=1 Tax=Cellulomonas persica TaxID=76861 RepID=A0A510UUU8_9CELL|nr:hypothetical protein CPE01_21960 [Cellulomonas persica]
MPHLITSVTSVNLAQSTPGDVVRVTRIDLDGAMRKRCRELGLAPGAVVHVTHRGGFGGRVVGIGLDRFALDAQTCVHVYVAPVDVPTS